MGKGGKGKAAPKVNLAKGHGKGWQPPPQPQPSKLIRYMLREWAWGKMSPQQLQNIASLVMDDFHEFKEKGDIPDVRRIAGIGAHGSIPGNMHRDLTNQLATQKLPDPYAITLRCATGTTGIFNPLKFTMLLPHELFATMFKSYNEFFRRCVCSGSDELVKFWNDMAGHPALNDNVVLDIDDYKNKVVPLGLHGDGVPVKGIGKSWSESMSCYSFNSIVAPGGNTLETNFVIFMVFEHLISRKGACRTMNRFWKVMKWSFTALFNGKWPTEDPDGNAILSAQAGTDLAGGLRGMIFTVKGDWEYLNKDSGIHKWGGGGGKMHEVIHNQQYIHPWNIKYYMVSRVRSKP